jgi:peptide/nickel transport system permease protein
LYAVFVLWGVISLVFFLFQVLPGDPARMMLDQQEGSEQLDLIRQKYGFDQPIGKQYVLYLNDLSPMAVHPETEAMNALDTEKYSYIRLWKGTDRSLILKVPYLRESFQRSGKEVVDIIGQTLPNTIVLAIAAMALAFLLGLLLGIISAVSVNSWIDRAISVISVLGMALPSFFSSILIAWLFGFVWHHWTGLQMTGSLYEIDDFGEGRYIAWKNLILPALTLGIRPLAVITQLSRNSLLEVLSQDYIRTARAKGLSFVQILKRHALQNAMNPVITASSGWFASMLAGAVFVEYIFGWNGLGREIVQALNTLDLPVIMGAVITISTAFVLVNISVDLSYTLLDPRIRKK